MRTARPHRSRAMPARKANVRRQLRLEKLEARSLLTSTLLPQNDLPMLSTHGGVCNCPVCTGVGLDEIPVVAAAAMPSAAMASLAGLPQLSSNPSAQRKLFLDFNGHSQPHWGGFTNIATPAFDQDGNPTSLSSGEIAAIREIWTRVAEDYAPFNVNVTTIDPGQSAGVARVAIGGHYSDWYQSSAGGVAYVGGFTSSTLNVAYVFEDALGNGNPRYVAEAASHEAGHLFGLQHQAVWSGNNLVEGYNSGSGNWAPIMGTGYYADRTTWHRGPTSLSASAVQDDMSIIAAALGWRSDDFGGTASTATSLATGSSVNLAGVIGSATDVDMWSFTTAGGSVSLQLAGAQFGGNFDAVLDLRNAAGQTIATSAPGASLGASLSATLGSGTYYVAVRSSGGYGNAGQYTLRGTLPGGVSTSMPEISLRTAGVELADGGGTNFGSTRVGTSVLRTFTVTNRGQGTLVLTPLSSTAMPAGFSLYRNLGDTTLTAGQSTTFTLRFDARTTGNFAGQFVLRSNDTNEAAFNLRLSATSTTTSATTTPPLVTGSSAGTLVKRTLDNGAAGYTSGGVWTTVTGRGVASDLNQAAGGSGSSTATWSFTSLPNGRYQVYGSWTGAAANASNAPFTLYNGSTPLATVRQNQRVNSAGLTAEGASWKYLGVVNITAGRLNVRLSNQADGTVVADAIRILQVPVAATMEPAAADLGLLAWLGEPPDRTSHEEPESAADDADAQSITPRRRFAADYAVASMLPTTAAEEPFEGMGEVSAVNEASQETPDLSILDDAGLLSHASE